MLDGLAAENENIASDQELLELPDQPSLADPGITAEKDQDRLLAGGGLRRQLEFS
jgi:hypothetical protein